MTLSYHWEISLTRKWRIYSETTTNIHDKVTPIRVYQGIIDSTGTEAFAKQPKLAKLSRVLKSTLV